MKTFEGFWPAKSFCHDLCLSRHFLLYFEKVTNFPLLFQVTCPSSRVRCLIVFPDSQVFPPVPIGPSCAQIVCVSLSLSPECCLHSMSLISRLLWYHSHRPLKARFSVSDKIHCDKSVQWRTAESVLDLFRAGLFPVTPAFRGFWDFAKEQQIKALVEIFWANSTVVSVALQETFTSLFTSPVSAPVSPSPQPASMSLPGAASTPLPGAAPTPELAFQPVPTPEPAFQPVPTPQPAFQPAPTPQPASSEVVLPQPAAATQYAAAAEVVLPKPPAATQPSAAAEVLPQPSAAAEILPQLSAGASRLAGASLFPRPSAF